MGNETWGYCDQCPTMYTVGAESFKQMYGRCDDLSLQSEEGWPQNGCRGIIRPLAEIPTPQRYRLWALGTLLSYGLSTSGHPPDERLVAAMVYTMNHAAHWDLERARPLCETARLDNDAMSRNSRGRERAASYPELTGRR